MPPKRIIKNSNKSKPPAPLNSSGNAEDSDESKEAELKFDQEVLWCISQFEKLLSTGKLSDAKKNESLKAINTLRKPGTAKIQKIQLMKQYFKDYKSKMLKEEELSKQQSSVNFQSEALSDTSKGVFVKKKALTEVIQESSNVSSGFLFNFKDPSVDESSVDLSAKVNSLKLS